MPEVGFSKPIDITKLVKQIQRFAAQSPLAATPIPTPALTGILAACLDAARGIGGLKFTLHAEGKILALSAADLPQYLASLGLNPQQITTVVYGLFREIRELGTLTPGEDNTIHIDREKLLKMAKDPLLESALHSLFTKIQRSKNIEVIFQKGGGTDSLVAPDLRHNAHGVEAVRPKEDETRPAVIEIVDLAKFLDACGIDPQLAHEAMKEKALLKGEENEVKA